MIRLTVSRDEERLAVYEFDGDEVLVGRAPPADVVLGTEAVSRRHTRLNRKDGAWRVADLGAANGVFLQRKGAPAPARVIVEDLGHGDVICIERFRLLFEDFPHASAAMKGLVEGAALATQEVSKPTMVLNLATVAAALSQPPPGAAPQPTPDRTVLDAHLALGAGVPMSLRTRESGGAPWHLEVYEPGRSTPRRLDLGSIPLQFGSDPSCEVRLAGLTASRFAASAEMQGGKVLVKRLSTGILGTKLLVDGEPVKLAELLHGQKFSVGDIHVIVRAPSRAN